MFYFYSSIWQIIDGMTPNWLHICLILLRGEFSEKKFAGNNVDID